MSSSALKLTCKKCDGFLTICLIRNRQVCQHCEQNIEIDEELSKRLKSTRQILLQQSPQTQQLKAQRNGKYGPSLPAFLLAIIWGIVGGWPLALPELSHPNALDVLTGGQIKSAQESVLWWIIYLPITGFTLHYFFDRWSDKISALVIPLIRPMKPLGNGREPRCRTCNAELPTGGKFRRCDQCQSDHLLDRDQYQEEDDEIDEALEQFLNRSRNGISQIENHAEKIGKIGFRILLAYPIISLIPVFFFGSFPETILPVHPALWIIPGVFLFIGILYGAASKAAEPIQTGGHHRPTLGDQMKLDDGAWCVTHVIISRTQLIESWPKEQNVKILLISREAHKEPNHAILLHWPEEQPGQIIRYQVNTVAKIHEEVTEEWEHSVMVDLLSRPKDRFHTDLLEGKLNWLLEGARVLPIRNNGKEVRAPEQLWLSLAQKTDFLDQELTLEQPEALRPGSLQRIVKTRKWMP